MIKCIYFIMGTLRFWFLEQLRKWNYTTCRCDHAGTGYILRNTLSIKWLINSRITRILPFSGYLCIVVVVRRSMESIIHVYCLKLFSHAIIVRSRFKHRTTWIRDSSFSYLFLFVYYYFDIGGNHLSRYLTCCMRPYQFTG